MKVYRKSLTVSGFPTDVEIRMKDEQGKSVVVGIARLRTQICIGTVLCTPPPKKKRTR